MNNPLNQEYIQNILISLIERDPDFQIKNLIAKYLSLHNPKLLVEYGMKSKDKIVKDIIALSLNEYQNVLKELFVWFKNEDDEKVAEHLFDSISNILNKEQILDENIVNEVRNITINLIENKRYFYLALELLGFLPDDKIESLYYNYLTNLRFDNEAIIAILKGLRHLATKTHSINSHLNEKLTLMINSPFELVEIRTLALLALENTENNDLIDLVESIIETETNNQLRKLAVEITGRKNFFNLSPLLAERLKYDGVSDIRAAAAYALGELNAFETLPELTEALESDPSFSVREAAAESLGVIKSQEALTTLIKGLVDQDSYVRSVSAWSIEQLDIKREDNFILELCNLCRSDEIDIQVKSGILILLTRLSTNKTALNCLMSLFKEDNSNFREIIIETLEDFIPIMKEEEIFYKDFLPFIQELMIKSRSFSLRANICTFLGNLKEDSTYPFLFDRLINDPDPLVKRQAAWAISKLNPINLKDRILREIKRDYPKETVFLFLEILSSWAEEEDIAIVKNYIFSEDLEIRQHAVELLTAIIDYVEDISENKMEELVQLLIGILNNDPVNTVRAAAAHTLGHIVGFNSLIDKNLISSIKKDKIYSVRELAAEALGFRGGETVIPELLQLINPEVEKDPSIRYFAIIALCDIDSKLG
ncbi:MAG: HEAT repeat domain-containing protein [Candidatus Hodarchaeales archaeon]